MNGTIFDYVKQPEDLLKVQAQAVGFLDGLAERVRAGHTRSSVLATGALTGVLVGLDAVATICQFAPNDDAGYRLIAPISERLKKLKEAMEHAGA